MAALPALVSSAKWGYQPLRALPRGLAEQLHAVQTKYFESILHPRVPPAPMGLSFLEVTWTRGGAGNSCRPWAGSGRGGTERLGAWTAGAGWDPGSSQGLREWPGPRSVWGWPRGGPWVRLCDQRCTGMGQRIEKVGAGLPGRSGGLATGEILARM